MPGPVGNRLIHKYGRVGKDAGQGGGIKVDRAMSSGSSFVTLNRAPCVLSMLTFAV
ncbi:MAG TPA: hypothetical protein VNJ10_05575 [Sphingomonas sp.]|nr:hypothetical protein [Sphingomonas sp.]